MKKLFTIVIVMVAMVVGLKITSYADTNKTLTWETAQVVAWEALGDGEERYVFRLESREEQTRDWYSLDNVHFLPWEEVNVALLNGEIVKVVKSGMCPWVDTDCMKLKVLPVIESTRVYNGYKTVFNDGAYTVSCITVEKANKGDKYYVYEYESPEMGRICYECEKFVASVVVK